jgi:hypothetical protein
MVRLPEPFVIFPVPEGDRMREYVGEVSLDMNHRISGGHSEALFGFLLEHSTVGEVVYAPSGKEGARQYSTRCGLSWSAQRRDSASAVPA